MELENDHQRSPVAGFGKLGEPKGRKSQETRQRGALGICAAFAVDLVAMAVIFGSLWLAFETWPTVARALGFVVGKGLQ